MAVTVTRRQFEAMVADALDALPDEFAANLENVAIVVEDRPAPGEGALLGLYEGVALTERSPSESYLPDRIVIYREPLCAMVDDVDELADEVYVTVLHEIGHYFGIDDERLHELGWG